MSIHKHQWMPVILKFSNSETSFLKFEQCAVCCKLREIGPLIRSEGETLRWVKTRTQILKYFPGVPITETATSYGDFIKDHLARLQK